MEVDEASKALAEMRRRTEQTLRQGTPRRFPGWYLCGSVASLTLIWSSTDLDGWASMGVLVAGVALTIAITVLLERITGVRLRLRSQRVAPMMILAAIMLFVAILVGSVLRLFDVPADGTLGGLAGSLAWVAGLGRAQAAAAKPREEA